MRVRIKICCISSVEEARTAIAGGADALGLVGKMPSGPGPIPDKKIAEIGKIIYPPVSAVLLTSETTAQEIIRHASRTNATTVQLVDELTLADYKTLREKLPYLRMIQVIHVKDGDSIERALTIEDYVDAILLDSGNPRAEIKILGGTGNTHDWTISRQLVKEVRVPVFLAGGLNEDNVAEAISIVKPFAVDVCSGVRTEGKLDPGKLVRFVKAVHSV